MVNPFFDLFEVWNPPHNILLLVNLNDLGVKVLGIPSRKLDYSVYSGLLEEVRIFLANTLYPEEIRDVHPFEDKLW